MAVCYCGPAHQRTHWPTHKQTCVKPPPEVTTDMVLDAMAALSVAEASPGSTASGSVSKVLAGHDGEW
jgi:hypothetical protein